MSKQNHGNTKNPTTGMQSNNRRAEIRDDLDSRANEEQEFKGDDVTHNKKETEGERTNAGNKGK